MMVLSLHELEAQLIEQSALAAHSILSASESYSSVHADTLGEMLGLLEGLPVGAFDGEALGLVLGLAIGEFDGLVVGLMVGLRVAPV